MEQQPQLNEHNKQEYPPMHIGDFDTLLIKSTNNQYFIYIKVI